MTSFSEKFKTMTQTRLGLIPNFNKLTVLCVKPNLKPLPRLAMAFASAMLATTALLLAVPAHAAKPEPIVLVVGDSLSAEYGLKRGTGWVPLLSEKMALEKPALTVVNASISGDTTSGGRSRLNALLLQHKPAVVVIELGGNDALRGLPLDMTTKNLSVMTQAAKKSGAKVLLVGMQVPPNYGSAYSADFAALFGQVAKAQKVSLVPFLLKGIADTDDYAARFQADRIHPNEAQQPAMLANVWPELERLLP
jgi:acyl-CoA thioesterase-1